MLERFARRKGVSILISIQIPKATVPQSSVGVLNSDAPL